MSLTAAPGKHTAAYRELEARLARAEADNRALTARNEELVCELTSTIISASQYSARAAVAEEENGRLKDSHKDLRHTVIRAKAEHERLRRAVVNARPRITVAYQNLDRPYISHVQIPYPVPVGECTANDETQQLPILDLPESPWPAYRMRTA